MKIVIVGPGAIGCLFAYMLAKGKTNEVWLLDRDPARAEIISANGITLEGSDTVRNLRATADPNNIGIADLILICVKSYDTESASRSILSIVGNDTGILTLQNGLYNVETVARILSIGNIMAGVTSHGATTLGIGHVRHAGTGKTIIGAYKSRSNKEKIGQVADTLSLSGIQTEVTDDIYSVIWGKLIINSAINAVSALTRLRNGQLLMCEETRKLLEYVATESASVAHACNIALPYDDPVFAVENTCQLTSQNISSMLQDVLRAKRTEVDAINGAIVKEAVKVGAKAPINTALTCLVKGLEYSNKLKDIQAIKY